MRVQSAGGRACVAAKMFAICCHNSAYWTAQTFLIFVPKKNVAVLLIAKKLYFHNVKNTLQAGWATVCSGKYNNKWKLLLLLVEAFAEVITQERMQIFVYGRIKK